MHRPELKPRMPSIIQPKRDPEKELLLRPKTRLQLEKQPQPSPTPKPSLAASIGKAMDFLAGFAMFFAGASNDDVDTGLQMEMAPGNTLPQPAPTKTPDNKTPLNKAPSPSQTALPQADPLAWKRQNQQKPSFAMSPHALMPRPNAALAAAKALQQKQLEAQKLEQFKRLAAKRRPAPL